MCKLRFAQHVSNARWVGSQGVCLFLVKIGTVARFARCKLPSPACPVPIFGQKYKRMSETCEAENFKIFILVSVPFGHAGRQPLRGCVRRASRASFYSKKARCGPFGTASASTELGGWLVFSSARAFKARAAVWLSSVPFGHDQADSIDLGRQVWLLAKFLSQFLAGFWNQ